MKRHLVAAGLGAVVFAVAFVALAPAVTAQADLVELLAAKADEKGSAASADPVGFAAQQTTEQQLAHDLRWSAAYTCFVADEATTEAGLDLAEPEPCEGYEEALGIAEEEEPVEEEVADAVPLEDDAVAIAETVVDDAVASAVEALDDPDNAFETMWAFLDRSTRTALRLIGSVLDPLDDALDTIQGAAGVLGKGSAHTLAAPFLGAWWILSEGADATVRGLDATRSAAVDGAQTLADGVTRAASATADGAQSAGDGLAAAWQATVAAVGDVMSFVLGDDAAAENPRPLPSSDTVGSTAVDAEGLLEDVHGLVPR